MPLSPSRSAAFDILVRVEQGAFADEMLHSERLSQLSPADRGLCTEIVMGVLRWRSLLDEMIGRWSKTPSHKLDTEVLTALRVGAYQITHLERVPAHAAVDQAVELVKQSRRRFAAPMVNAIMRKISASTRAAAAQAPGGDALKAIAHDCAHPHWLVERWAAEYGLDSVQQIARCDQQIPTPTLRLADAGAEQELRSEGIELAPGALLTSARRVVSGDVTKTRAFAESRVYLQDEASQLVALLVGRGTRLLDCCAAPGGKAAVMAERNPTSLVIAAELHPGRARLMRRLARAPNICVVAANAEALPVVGSFDRALADVPCSGTGTLARNPEIKWRLRPEDLRDLHQRQVGILRAVLGYLSPGGRLVYSTCSLEREENEDVVAEVLQGRTDVRMLDCREQLQTMDELAWQNLDSLVRGKFLRTLPGIHPCDGFFAALLEKV